MNPKDPKWNFYEVTEITKCRECGTVVRAKSDRLKTHREKCAKKFHFGSFGFIFSTFILLCNFRMT
jgi:hypothetical protein